MSRYSGRFDFYDWLGSGTHEEFITGKRLVYIGENIVPLWIRSEADLIPYYAHPIAVGSNNIVMLGQESIPDEMLRNRNTAEGRQLIYDLYKKPLYDLMVQNGWNESRAKLWIFGMDSITAE